MGMFLSIHPLYSPLYGLWGAGEAAFGAYSGYLELKLKTRSFKNNSTRILSCCHCFHSQVLAYLPCCNSGEQSRSTNSVLNVLWFWNGRLTVKRHGTLYRMETNTNSFELWVIPWGVGQQTACRGSCWGQPPGSELRALRTVSELDKRVSYGFWAACQGGS